MTTAIRSGQRKRTRVRNKPAARIGTVKDYRCRWRQARKDRRLGKRTCTYINTCTCACTPLLVPTTPAPIPVPIIPYLHQCLHLHLHLYSVVLSTCTCLKLAGSCSDSTVTVTVTVTVTTTMCDSNVLLFSLLCSDTVALQ
jgi:hypothetical protein